MEVEVDRNGARICCKGPYTALLRFVAPVALTLIAIDIGEQALNRSLASSFNAVNTLASFGIAYIIIKLASGTISEVKMVSIMLVHNHSDRLRVGICVLVFWAFVVVFCLLTGLTKLGFILIDELHSVPPDVGDLAKKTILYLIILPLIDGVALLHAGILLKYKYSVTVGGASVLDNVVQVLTVIVLLQTKLSQTNPIIIPILAAYFGTLARLITVLIAYYKFIHHKLANDPVLVNTVAMVNTVAKKNKLEDTVTYRRILTFWAPLAMVQICQRICRPIVNLFVARERTGSVTREDAVKAVAVLSVCYPVGHLPYGWLNVLRSVEPAFKKKLHERETNVSVKNIRVFQFGCFLVSVTVMIVFFWIPGVAPAILSTISDVNQDMINRSIMVLHVFSFFPIPVTNRAVLTGNFVSHSQTKYLYPSIPARIIALISMLFILPRLGVHGSLMGVSALISGFIAESLLTLIMAFVYRCRTGSVTARKDEDVLIAEDETKDI